MKKLIIPNTSSAHVLTCFVFSLVKALLVGLCIFQATAIAACTRVAPVHRNNMHFACIIMMRLIKQRRQELYLITTVLVLSGDLSAVTSGLCSVFVSLRHLKLELRQRFHVDFDLLLGEAETVLLSQGRKNCDVWPVLLRHTLLYQSLSTVHTIFKQPVLQILAQDKAGSPFYFDLLFRVLWFLNVLTHFVKGRQINSLVKNQRSRLL